MIEHPQSPAAWKARIDACKSQRRDLLSAWTLNVDYRRGKPFAEDSDEDRVNVNIDWGLTKSKHAQLFSQVPSVIVSPSNMAAQTLLNKELTKANVGAAVDESVIDAINASGIGAVMIRYEAKTEDVDVPAVDPMTAQMLQAAGQKVPTTKATRTTSDRYVIERFSPTDLLWDVTFTGSDFDHSPWIGRSGVMFWNEAVTAFKLKPTDRERVCGGEREEENLRQDSTTARRATDHLVNYDEVFYWSHTFNPEEKYFTALRRLVFVHGIETPVIDEPWNGQRLDPQTGKYLGACQFPIRVLTLSYISDDAIPPSDTAIGRPQVQELVRSRTQMLLQRDRSVPVRWHDINRIDPLVSSNLMRGVTQASIPVQGNGSQAIGEVARANYPREDFEFDRITKQDLTEQWSLGANQLGQFASGERSATEAGVIARGNESRIGYERKRVEKFFIGIARVLAGLMHLYGEFPPVEDLTIRPDSTVLLDAETRMRQLAQFLNLTAKSGYYDPKDVIAEMAALANAPVEIKPPNPPKPEAPNVSLRLSGEDLLNPFNVAMLLKSGQGPSPEELDAAKVLIQNLTTPPQPPQQPPQGPGQPPDLSQMGPGLERITKRQDEV